MSNFMLLKAQNILESIEGVNKYNTDADIREHAERLAQCCVDQNELIHTETRLPWMKLNEAESLIQQLAALHTDSTGDRTCDECGYISPCRTEQAISNYK